LRPAFTAAETHGASGLGYAVLPPSPVPAASEHGVDFIIREIMAQPGEVTLVPVAPLTNIAMAIRKAPQIVTAVRQVIIMGGAVRADGNTTSLAEFNFFVDPHAAHIVLTSGMPITLVPWDITVEVMLFQQHIDRLLMIDSPVSRFIAAATRFYMEFHQASFGVSGCAINDPLAAALLIKPDLVEYVDYHVTVELKGDHNVAKTSADHFKAMGKAPNSKVAMKVDVEAFMDFFIERVNKL
jgi:purine nucleosidase